MSVKNLQAIDVHAHLGDYRGSIAPIADKWRSGGPEIVLARANLANTRLTIISSITSVLPVSDSDLSTGNKQAALAARQNPQLRFWVVINPLKPESFAQATDYLSQKGCVGIKIHPEGHNYPIADHGYDIFDFAAKHHAILLSHSGAKNSMPHLLVKFANEFPEVKLILAHLGNGWDGDPTHQVRAIQSSKHDNVFVDTSSEFSITPSLIEWAVSEIDAEKILYGTDSPLYFAPMQRARIDSADIADADKKLILCQNAERLFKF